MVLVAVVGAGLTTALKIQRLGHEVVVIAELFPGDEKSTRYTSNWAGANHMSMAGDNVLQRKLDEETFDIMWKMSESGADTETLFMRTPTMMYSVPDPNILKHWAEVYPDFRYLAESELPAQAKSAVEFTTVTIDIWRYLQYLYSQFIIAGGRAVRSHVQHISQVLSGAFSAVPDALVVCAGIGARTLGGVEDKDVFPIRGQTILIRAPWVKFCKGTIGPVAGYMPYIIPRRTGDVILGGTWLPDDWYPKPRPATKDYILEATLELAPELAPPHVRESGRKPTVADIESLIVEQGCGFRPGRKGGIRLERDSIGSPAGKRVPIVYNYGHGGAGYQSSWGSAAMAADLLNEGLQEC